MEPPQNSENQRSIACQTDNLEPDEATLRNELAMGAYLEILGILDDDRQPVYHDLGEAYANQVFLQAIAVDQPMEDDQDLAVSAMAHDEAEEATPLATPAGEAAEAATDGAACPDSSSSEQRLRSLESEVIEAEWSLRCKLAQVRESAKHPVQRWLEGALPTTATASPFASRAPSVYQQQQQQQQHYPCRQRHLSATASHCSRPSSVAGLSEVFVSDSDDEDEEEEMDDETAARPAADAGGVGDAAGGLAVAGGKSEMTFYSCAVHGIEVPESFVRIKVKGGGGGRGGGGGGGGGDGGGIGTDSSMSQCD